MTAPTRHLDVWDVAIAHSDPMIMPFHRLPSRPDTRANASSKPLRTPGIRSVAGT
jgi:hypothetical protein